MPRKQILQAGRKGSRAETKAAIPNMAMTRACPFPGTFRQFPAM